MFGKKKCSNFNCETKVTKSYKFCQLHSCNHIGCTNPKINLTNYLYCSDHVNQYIKTKCGCTITPYGTFSNQKCSQHRCAVSTCFHQPDSSSRYCITHQCAGQNCYAKADINDLYRRKNLCLNCFMDLYKLQKIAKMPKIQISEPKVAKKVAKKVVKEIKPKKSKDIKPKAKKVDNSKKTKENKKNKKGKVGKKKTDSSTDVQQPLVLL